jgi:hypothetical protein
LITSTLRRLFTNWTFSRRTESSRSLPSSAWIGSSRSAGWRLYITYAKDSGKSFFRYRNPETRAIETLMDKVWDLRLFWVTTGKPLWHAICVEIDRFSIGYCNPAPEYETSSVVGVHPEPAPDSYPGEVSA